MPRSRRRYNNFDISCIFPAGKGTMTIEEGNGIRSYVNDEIKNSHSDIRRDIRSKYKDAKIGHHEEYFWMILDNVGIIVGFDIN